MLLLNLLLTCELSRKRLESQKTSKAITSCNYLAQLLRSLALR